MMTVVDQQSPWLIPSSTLARDDPVPARRQHDDDRHRQAEEPAGNEDLLAADAVGEASGEQVGQRLDDAEGDDEGEGDRARGQAELLLGQERHDGPLQPDHAADEGVDQDQEAELLPVLAQTEPDRRRGRARRRHSGWLPPPDRSGRRPASRRLH